MNGLKLLSEGERGESPGVLDTRCLKELRLFFFFFVSLSVQRAVRPNDITLSSLLVVVRFGQVTCRRNSAPSGSVCFSLANYCSRHQLAFSQFNVFARREVTVAV